MLDVSGHSLDAMQLCPTTVLTVHLNSPCSSVLLASCPVNEPYFIVGKATGEIIFFPSGNDRSGGVTKFVAEGDSAVTALATGKLRHTSRAEVVAITASGRLQCLSFPCRSTVGVCESPMLLFSQLLHANIAYAHLIDLDNDGREELVVAMTDRVVRTYRFLDSRLMPLNKWELPAQICGCAIARVGGNVQAVLSQASQMYFVRLKFGLTSEVSVHSIHSTPQVASTVVSQLVLPIDLVHVSILNSLALRVLLMNSECASEVELRRCGGPISAIATIALTPSLRLLITVDLRGVLLIYAWRANLIKDTDPLVRCHVLANVNHLSVLAASSQSILVGVVTVYFQVAVYFINLKSLVLKL